MAQISCVPLERQLRRSVIVLSQCEACRSVVDLLLLCLCLFVCFLFSSVHISQRVASWDRIGSTDSCIWGQIVFRLFLFVIAFAKYETNTLLYCVKREEKQLVKIEKRRVKKQPKKLLEGNRRYNFLGRQWPGLSGVFFFSWPCAFTSRTQDDGGPCGHHIRSRNRRLPSTTTTTAVAAVRFCA